MVEEHKTETKKTESPLHRASHEEKLEHKVESPLHSHEHHEHKTEQKEEEKPEQKPKKEKKEVKHPKKTEVFALGASMPISTKHSKEISRFISGKNPEEALELLEQAKSMKIAIPFRGEIPHRKGKGMMSGRYPVTAVGYFIRVLKSAVANASLHNLNITNSRIHSQADMASRPRRRFGSERFKRTNLKITISELKEKQKLDVSPLHMASQIKEEKK